MTSVHTWNEFLGAQAEAALARRVPETSHHPVEVVIYRDPDGRSADGVDVQVVIDGEPVDARVFVVDPGAGYSLEDWEADRDTAVRQASPAAAEVIAAFYETGAETEFVIDDREPPEPTGALDTAVDDEHGEEVASSG